LTKIGCRSLTGWCDNNKQMCTLLGHYNMALHYFSNRDQFLVLAAGTPACQIRGVAGVNLFKL